MSFKERRGKNTTSKVQGVTTKTTYRRAKHCEAQGNN